MIIIVKNIKPGIKIDNIESFIKPAMKNRLFFKRAEIQSIKIIKLVDKAKRTEEHHGIIRIANDPAKNVLNQLKSRAQGNGNDQLIDEYVIRQWRNDRRLMIPELLTTPKDRRKVDRRRKGLKIVTVCEKLIIPNTGDIDELERHASSNSQYSWDTVPERRSTK
jgi:hypothetical protein